jgi:ribosomal protein S18 acetylase RimI-like enzyme
MPGSAADFRKLARFHYCAAAPASFALTMTIDHVTGMAGRRVVAVGVLSNPALSCRAREAALALSRVPREWRWEYLNRHLRTVSRVIVHPQYRGIGLASEVVRCLVRQSPTRYVEAISRLVMHHPLFERAGMTNLAPGYYLCDRMHEATAARRITEGLVKQVCL